MRHRLLVLLVTAGVVALPGCSYLCRFEARGTIREAMTGQPIPAVKVALIDAQGNALAATTTTDAQGEFALDFKTSPSAAHVRTGWRLVLTAEGFASESIEVGTVKEPRDANETVYLIFRPFMRRAS